MTRKAEALALIKNHVLWSMGAGLVPVPILDLVAVTAVQLDMIRKLCTLYEVDYSEAEGKAWLSAITGSTLARLSAGLLKAIPGFGTLIGGVSMSLMSGASTYAVGQVALDQFVNARTMADLDVDTGKAVYEEKVEEGKTVAKKWKAEHDTQKKPSGSTEDDVFQKLEKLGELKAKGILSEQEFEAKKQALLDQI